MSISTQIKLLNSFWELLTDDKKLILPSSCEPKPSFPKMPVLGIPLPRCTPEETGLDSHMLENFVRDVAQNPVISAHSLLILCKGKLICEGYFSPYQRDIWHVAHSLSKTFTGTAVGLALREGLFQLDDPVTEYFPEQVGLLGRLRLKGLTVRHLLNMTSGISFSEINVLVESDWIKGIFSSSLNHEPGATFDYNSLNSYLLAALVVRTCGKTLMEYLKPRLFEPLGFGPVAWEKGHGGIEKGGWGLYIMPEDLAKLGQLYLNKGRWLVEGETRQILPESWVNEAIQCQAGSGREGYGYHLWVDEESENPTMNGMFGQFVTLVPQSDICIVMTAGCPVVFHDSPAYQLIQQYFYKLPPLSDALPPNPRALSNLSGSLQALRFGHPLPSLNRTPVCRRLRSEKTRWNQRPLRSSTPLCDGYDAFLGTTWKFAPNRAGLLPLVVQAMDNNFTSGIVALRLERQNDHLMLFWEEREATLCLPLGIHREEKGEICICEESFITACRANIKQNEDGEDILCIEIFLLEHSSMRLIKLRRQGDNLLLQLEERPNLSDALEIALSRKGEGLAEMGGGGAIGGFIKNDEYLRYRIAQFCTPKVLGTPL